tara:strand:+ start:2590 stop:3939 length:1350 start_codon:yes stop_codon:yes gene_type:complete
MAITDINISEKLEAGAPSIKYTGNMDPNMEPNMQVASDPSWEAEWEDAYQNYKAKQISLNQEFVDKETFMEQYQNNMASGGRAHFGLGSIIKKITKPIKKLAKSPIGKAGILGLAGFGLGGGFGPGGFSWGNLPGMTSARNFFMGSPLGYKTAGDAVARSSGFLSNIIPSSTMGKVALAGGLGLTAASAFEGMEEDDVKALRNNPEALRAHLTQYYKNVNPDKSDEEVSTWVETQMYSTGGRVGYAHGTKDENKLTEKQLKELTKNFERDMYYQYMPDSTTRRSGFPPWTKTKFKAKGGRIGYAEGNDDKEGIIEVEMSIADRWEKIKELMKKMEEIKSGKTTAPDKKAQGGRMGFAYGPDQTAQAAGIMEGLPTRNNAAGVKELDLRDSGGFIPPVGIKEKADDIPAMLSNNEFVFTADAVRAAGGGSVEKGAQVMYDTMKNLENKVG